MDVVIATAETAGGDDVAGGVASSPSAVSMEEILGVSEAAGLSHQTLIGPTLSLDAVTLSPQSLAGGVALSPAAVVMEETLGASKVADLSPKTLNGPTLSLDAVSLSPLSPAGGENVAGVVASSPALVAMEETLGASEAAGLSPKTLIFPTLSLDAVTLSPPSPPGGDNVAGGVASSPAAVPMEETIGASQAADLSPKILNGLTLFADAVSQSPPSSDGDDKTSSEEEGEAADGLEGGCSEGPLLVIRYWEEPVCTCYDFRRIWACLRWNRRSCPVHWCPRWEDFGRRRYGYREEEEAHTRIDSFCPTGVGAGLENLGNTCFMNSILQCFAHTVPLVKALRSFSHEQPCDGEEFCVVCTLHEHIELCLANSGKIIEPEKFCKNLSNICSDFNLGQQEDAHEFLQCFLDKLERSSQQSTSSDTSPATKENNLVEQIFGGRLVSKLLCGNCGHCSEIFEPLNGISLGIADADTLENVLESFTKVEKIEDTTCQNCKEKVTKEKQLMLDKTPSVAALHLKRFKTHGIYVEKISNHVKFPLELDLKPYTIDHQDSSAETKYQLYGFVVHRGFMPTGGHYFCFIRSSPDKWHKLDDSMVREVEEEEVLSEAPYILFYAREGTPWFSSLLEPQKLCPEFSNLATSPKSVLYNMNDATSPKSVLYNMNDGKHTVYPDLRGADNLDARTTEEVIESNSMDFLRNMKHEGRSTSETMDDAAENGAGIFFAADQLGHNCNEFSVDTPMADAVVPLRETTQTVRNDTNEAHINIDSQNGGCSLMPLAFSPGSYSERLPGTRHTLAREHMKTENRVVSKREALKFLGQSNMPNSRKMMLLAAIIPRRDGKRRPRPSPRKKTISPISCTKLLRHMRPYYSLRRKLARRIGFSGQ